MTTVVIPALIEACNIKLVIELAKRSPAVGEIVVDDDGSIDDTRDCAVRSGARVVTSSLLGKGASMEDGFLESNGDIVVFLDGDLRGLASDLIERLVEPIQDGSADFVKARFSRSAARVTILTAKPLIETFFPELAYFAQPLGAIIAVRRSALERLTFEADYGVDLALLIDARFLGLRLAEVDIGHLEHHSQTLEALGKMAKQVARALLHRAEKHGRLHIRQVREVEEIERQTDLPARFDRK
ncbi:MAG: glycosyltransferase [Acidobacteria bacterium]|nr:glycosyltransferase [Acidobacteriota bacterium]